MLSIILLVIGVVGVLFVKRRRFYRRNEMGLEQFKSYGGMVATGLFEKIIYLVSWSLIIFALIRPLLVK